MGVFFKNISFFLMVEALRGLEVGTLGISHSDSQKAKKSGTVCSPRNVGPKHVFRKINGASSVPFLFLLFKTMRKMVYC